jgi:hypothetical protein
LLTISLFFASPNTRNRPDLTDTNVIFSEIFGPTLKLILSHTQSMIDSSFDAVGLLLCIRINNLNLLAMQKRLIPCFDSFLNGLNLYLWPRFQAIIDRHIESLRKARMTVNDTHPHYITRRYAEFSASILLLNDGYNDALLMNSLTRLRSEVESLLVRMSADMNNRKFRIIFLINNTDLVCSILSVCNWFNTQEHTATSLDSEKIYFDTILEQQTIEYVDEELYPMFSSLISFVNIAEGDENLSEFDAGIV